MRATALALLVALVACPAAARAQALDLLQGAEGVAVTDDARAPLVNPAAAGARYPSEVLFGVTRAEDGAQWGAAALTMGGAGAFGWARRGEGRALGASLALGGERLRWGAATTWRTEERPARETFADHRLGMLARPAPWLSLGAVVEHVGEPVVRGARLEREYALGAGLRPLALDRSLAWALGPRLTLSGDVVLREGAATSAARVRVGVELEPVPGVALRASVGDHGGVRAGLALHGVRASVQAARAQSRRDGAWIRAQDGVFVSLHEGEERTALRTRAERRVAEIRVGGRLTDEPDRGPSLLGASGGTSSRALHRQLERALEDPLTRGVLLDLRGVAGMAQIEELRPRLERLEAAGKPVVAWLELGGGRGDLYLASVASRVVAYREGAFGPLGLSVEKRYWRGPLARAGVRVDRSSIGAFKSAYREFSVDSIPSADSLVIEQTLDTLQSLFVSGIESARHVPRARFEHLLDGRRWESADLVGAGLVDEVGFREDARRALGRLAGLGDRPRGVNLARVRVASRAWTVPTRVAVVYASGGITLGRSGNDLLEGATLGHETLIGQLERAARRPDVRAVVLRVDSPGGLSLASGLMAHGVERIRRETKKPVVVSMAGTAASGGYDLACNADWIFANRFTRTGSIGVVFIKPSLEGLYGKLGVHEDAFRRGDYMDGWSPTTDWDERLQAAADSSVARTYDFFVDHVAKGRKLEREPVIQVAQGRVWLGDEAKAHRLVDAIGGLEDAIAEARRRGGVPAGERIRLAEYGRPRPGLVQRVVGQWLRDRLAPELSLASLRGGMLARDGRLDLLPE